MEKHKPEQIVALLRQVEVELANGKTTPLAWKEAEIAVETHYRWRKEFGGLELDQAMSSRERNCGRNCGAVGLFTRREKAS
jgi:putative transposase